MALVDDYEAAVRGGDTKTANYLAQMLASQAGININSNQVGAAPASMLPGGGISATAPASGSGFWGGFQHGVNSLLDTIDSIDPTSKKNGGTNPLSSSGIAKGLDSAVSGVTDAVSGTSAAIKFITNIPRVATTLLGLILIIAGIFALSRGAAVQIISSAEGTKEHLGALKEAKNVLRHPVKAVTP